MIYSLCRWQNIAFAFEKDILRDIMALLLIKFPQKAI
jgi:hypothetical protein